MRGWVGLMGSNWCVDGGTSVEWHFEMGWHFEMEWRKMEMDL